MQKKGLAKCGKKRCLPDVRIPYATTVLNEWVNGAITLGGVKLEQPPAEQIAAACERVKAMLLAKNASYGNSALEPIRVFSRASAAEGIRVRLDDKLSRLAKGNNQYDEDTIGDIIGYLVLLQIAEGK
jgi:hypothetical protein